MKIRNYLALFIFLAGLFFFVCNKVSITGAYIGASNPGSMVGIFLMLLSSFVYLSKKGRHLVHITSSINEEGGLARLAKEAASSDSVQRDLDKMTVKLQEGDYGSAKSLRGTSKIKYLRGMDSGARLFFEEVGDDIVIRGKASKKNEKKVIKKIIKLYD